jgi:signal transduction histidine kinase
MSTIDLARLRDTQTLLAVARALSLRLDTVEAMRRVTRQVALAFGADMVGAYTHDPASGVLRPVAGYHVPPTLREWFRGTSLATAGSPALEAAWRERTPVWTADATRDPAWPAAARALPPHSALLAPMAAGREPAGALGLVWWVTGRSFGADELALAADVAAQVGLGLEHRAQARAMGDAEKMEAIARLAGGIANDFNNLLTVISGRGQLILHRLLADDPSRRDLDLIRRAAERAASLTRQLLAFGRQQPWEPRALSVNAIVADLGPALERLVGDDIELATALDPGVGPVEADPRQLEQLVLGLVTNAREAMPGGGRVTLATADAVLAATPAAAGPGAYVVLSVTDTGVGMSAEVQVRMFEPFFTTRGPGHGRGLGLAVVYGIVKQHGGDITMASAPGGGTVVRVFLPRRPPP